MKKQDKILKKVSSKLAKGSTELKAESDNFLFLVRRKIGPQGYIYQVECTPKNQSWNQTAGARNAKLLARFLRDGLIDEALLVR